MKKGRIVQLSRPFWNSYKLFLKGEISLTELKRNFGFPRDILFYKVECDSDCKVLTELRQLQSKKLNALIDSLLSAMKGLNDESKKSLFKKIIVIFLGNYVCFAKGTAKEKSKDIMLYFVSTMGKPPVDENLTQRSLEMLHLLLSSREMVKDKGEFIKPIIFKLICLYAGLAISDREGQMKCKDLGKELSYKWSKSTPESVTLHYLKKKERNSRLPINECELLGKFSF